MTCTDFFLIFYSNLITTSFKTFKFTESISRLIPAGRSSILYRLHYKLNGSSQLNVKVIKLNQLNNLNN